MRKVLDELKEMQLIFEKIQEKDIAMGLGYVIYKIKEKGLPMDDLLRSGSQVEAKFETIPKCKVKHLIDEIRPSEELMKRDCFSQFVGSVCNLFEEKLLKE